MFTGIIETFQRFSFQIFIESFVCKYDIYYSSVRNLDTVFWRLNYSAAGVYIVSKPTSIVTAHWSYIEYIRNIHIFNSPIWIFVSFLCLDCSLMKFCYFNYSPAFYDEPSPETVLLKQHFR